MINMKIDYKNKHEDAIIYVKNVVKLLTEKELIDTVDTASIQMLLNNYSIYLKATEQMGDYYTIINTVGNIVSNPLNKIANDAQIQCTKIFKNFGLSALDRKKLEGNLGDDDDDLINNYL